MAQQPNSGHNRLRVHYILNIQQKQQKNSQALSGIWTRNPNNQAYADLCQGRMAIGMGKFKYEAQTALFKDPVRTAQ